MESMKHWLAIIKQGRIVHNDQNRLMDEFTHKGALNKALCLDNIDEYEFELNI